MAHLPWYVRHPRHYSAAQNKSLLSRLDAGHILRAIIIARIVHVPGMMSAREIRECAELINKVTYKPANDLAPGWKSPGPVSRASMGRKMSFRVSSAADQKRAEIKFPDGYGKVTTILPPLRKLTNWNPSEIWYPRMVVAEQSNDVAPTFTIAFSWTFIRLKAT